MHPVLILAAAAGATYLVFRGAEKRSTGFVPVPIPPPNPDGSPPRDMRVAPLVNLQIDLPAGPLAHGAPVSTAWEYMPGHPFEGDGGGAPLPLLWVSPDRKFAAVLWTLDPKLGVTFAKPGDVLMGLTRRAAV